MIESITAAIGGDTEMLKRIMHDAGEDVEQTERLMQAIDNKRAMDAAVAKVQQQWH